MKLRRSEPARYDRTPAPTTFGIYYQRITEVNIGGVARELLGAGA